MRTKVSIFTILLMGLAISQNIMAQDFSAKSPSGHTLFYRITGNEVSVANENINQRSELSGAIIIPSKVSYGQKVYAVTSIDDYAFIGGGQITSIVIPDGVRKIGRSCFLYCRNLANIYLPPSLTEIEPWAFGECIGLAELIIPNRTIEIGTDAFHNVRNVFYTGMALGEPWGAKNIIHESRIPNIPSNIFIENEVTEWSGTGWAIESGYIVTNYHVVDGARTISIKGIGGDLNTGYSAEVAATDKTNDIAVLKITDSRFKGFGTIPYAVSSRIADKGEGIFVLGYPMTQVLGNEIKYTAGEINSRTGFQGDVATYQISAPVTHGNSGGPMFDNRGNVIGIVNSGITDKEIAENVGYAIKTSYLKILVESAGLNITLPQNNTIANLSKQQIIKKVEKFVYYIECSK